MVLPATLENIQIGRVIYWNPETVPLDKRSRSCVGKVVDIGPNYVKLSYPGQGPLLYKIEELALCGVIYNP